MNVLNQLKQVPEVCDIFCDTADADVADRKKLLRTIGCRL